MSVEYPHDYHPLAPYVRQLRGALEWYRAAQVPVSREAIGALMERIGALPHARVDGRARALKVAAHWASLPAPTPELHAETYAGVSGAHNMTDEAEGLAPPAVAHSGPLPATSFPAVIHERHVVTSASFELPPPRDHQAEGSAQLMRPSLNLRRHRGETQEIVTPALETPALKTAIAPEVTQPQAQRGDQGGSAWGQTRPEPSPPHETTSATAPPSAQLWANKPQQSASAPQSEGPTKSPKLGASLARLNQSQSAARSASASAEEARAERATPTKPSPTRRREYDADERYAELCDRIRGCQSCPRAPHPTSLGAGHYGARIMFVTALSSEEDLLRGSPLLNPTERELFNQILRALKLSRLEVYITSLLKCGAELPRPEEWATCQGYFHSELELVQPEIVVTLGYVASVILLGEQVRLGTWGQYQGLNVMPTVHPSDIISGGDAVKRTAWKHLREVIRRSGQTS